MWWASELTYPKHSSTKAFASLSIMKSCRVQVLKTQSALDGTAWSSVTPFANSYWSVLFPSACFFSRPLAVVGPFLPLQTFTTWTVCSEHPDNPKHPTTAVSIKRRADSWETEATQRLLLAPGQVGVPRSHNLLACRCAHYRCCTSFCPWLSLERSCLVSPGSLSKVLWLLPSRYNLPIWLSIRRTALLLVTLLSPVQKKNSVSLLCTCKFDCETILAIIWSSLLEETSITESLWDFHTKCKTHFLGLGFLH